MLLIVGRRMILVAWMACNSGAEDDGEPVDGKTRSICDPQPDADEAVAIVIRVEHSTPHAAPGVAGVACIVSDVSYVPGRVDAAGLPADSKITLDCSTIEGAPETHVVQLGGTAAPDVRWMLGLDVVLDDLAEDGVCSPSGAWIRLTSADGGVLLAATTGNALLPHPWLAGSYPWLREIYPWYEQATAQQWYGLDIAVDGNACELEPDPFSSMCGADLYNRRAALDFTDGTDSIRIHDRRMGSLGPWRIVVHGAGQTQADQPQAPECVECSGYGRLGFGFSIVRTG